MRRATGAARARTTGAIVAIFAALAVGAIRALRASTIDVGLGAILLAVGALGRLADRAQADDADAIAADETAVSGSTQRAISAAVDVGFGPVPCVVAAVRGLADVVAANVALTVGI